MCKLYFLVIFALHIKSGDLQHGALESLCNSSISIASTERWTFLVNWWDKKPAAPNTIAAPRRMMDKLADITAERQHKTEDISTQEMLCENNSAAGHVCVAAVPATVAAFPHHVVIESINVSFWTDLTQHKVSISCLGFMLHG